MLEKARRAKYGTGGDQGKDKDKPDDAGFGRDAGSMHTFTGISNRRERKVLNRAVSVNAVATDVPRWLNWSEQPIMWSRADHAP